MTFWYTGDKKIRTCFKKTSRQVKKQGDNFSAFKNAFLENFFLNVT